LSFYKAKDLYDLKRNQSIHLLEYWLEEEKNRKMRVGAEKLSPAQTVVSNCPQPQGGLETLE
jgi:hypothetical protein